jgi:hypothetical protein
MSIRVLELVFRHQFDPSERMEEGPARYGCSGANKKLVMIAVADTANSDGERAYPGIRRIQRLSQLNLDTVRITLAHLLHEGYLELVTASDGRHADEYRVVLDRLTLEDGCAGDPRTPLNDHPRAARGSDPRASARVSARAQRHSVRTSCAVEPPSEDLAPWVPAPADSKEPAPPSPEDVAHMHTVMDQWRRGRLL